MGDRSQINLVTRRVVSKHWEVYLKRDFHFAFAIEGLSGFVSVLRHY
jgi:hypothetical protein